MFPILTIFDLMEGVRKYALAFLLLVPTLVRAEEPDPREQRPDLSLFSFETRLLPSLDVDNTDGEVSVRNSQIRALLPWRIKNDVSSLSATLGFESLAFKYDHWDPAAGPTTADRLYGAQVSFFYRRKLASPKWGFNAFVTPSLNSDFKAVTTRALRAQGGFLFNRFSGRGLWSFGAVFINDYGTPRVFPAIAYAGRPTERQTVTVRLPVLVSWAYQTSYTTETGLAARVSGNTYVLEEDGPRHHQSVRYSVGTIGPTFKWKPSSIFSLLLETGVTFRHRLEYWKDGERVNRLSFDPSGFLSVGVRLLFI
jgi:hypothetical protein